MTNRSLEEMIRAAAAPLLPVGIGDLYYHGLTGDLFRSSEAPALFADFEALWKPGLRALGAELEVDALPQDPDRIADRLRGAPGIALLRLAAQPPEIDAMPEAESAAGAGLCEKDRAAMVTDCGRPTEVSAAGVTWTNSMGETRTDSPERILESFTHVAMLSRAPGRGTRRINLTGAIQRAVIFSLAFEDRFIGEREADTERRAIASQFLLEAAGKQRDAVSLRWRQAGDLFGAGEVAAGRKRLYEALLRTLDLPEALQEALTLSSSGSLTNMQRRELVYLARAGQRDLKVLAISRLKSEGWSVAVRQTLSQFAVADDPLVRNAASPGGQ